MSCKSQTIPHAVRCAAPDDRCEPMVARDGRRSVLVCMPCGKRTSVTGPYCARHTESIEGVVVRPSQVSGAGLGLFAARDFRKGEPVSSYGGEVISMRELRRRYGRCGNFTQYGLTVTDKDGRSAVVDAVRSTDGNSRYANDARETRYDNNVLFHDSPDPWARMVAARDIHAGEEIFVSYGESYWNHE